MAHSPIVRIIKTASGKAILTVTIPAMVLSPPAALAYTWMRGATFELAETIPAQGQEASESKHAPGALMSSTSSSAFGVAVANPLAEVFIIGRGVRTIAEHFADKLTPVRMPASQLVPPSKSD